MTTPIDIDFVACKTGYTVSEMIDMNDGSKNGALICDLVLAHVKPDRIRNSRSQKIRSRALRKCSSHWRKQIATVKGRADVWQKKSAICNLRDLSIAAFA